MSVAEEFEFLRLMSVSPWPADRASGEIRLADLGLVSSGPAEGQGGGGCMIYGLSGSLGVSNNFTFTTFEGEFVAICFFMTRSPRPNELSTQRAYDALCTSLSKEFGAGKRAWEDEETPLGWRGGDLEIGAQLFDRRDSTVMVSIEHRERAERAEQAVRASRKSHDR